MKLMAFQFVSRICSKGGVDLKKLSENLIQHFLRQAVRDGFFMGYAQEIYL